MQASLKYYAPEKWKRLIVKFLIQKKFVRTIHLFSEISGKHRC